MRPKLTIAILLVIALSAGAALAQHWQQVFAAPTVGSCAYFFNPDAGCIGTGNYPGGYPAQIYYTFDGGKTWTRSLMPNMDLFGQVTDIYFTDRWNGWATVRERIEHGWSGVYRTTDGGKSWLLWFQAEFPVAIRQTRNGVFFTDRFVGIRRSTDGGVTFPVVAPSIGILGLDFLDDNTGFASSEGTAVGQVLITYDGGNNWNAVDIPHEAWTAYADVATGSLLLASERNVNLTNSGIFGSTDLGANFTARFTGPRDIITGGIGGPRWCRSVIYAQGQDSSAKYPGVTSMMRSLDGGFNWLRIGGPANYNDKRFAVTGKGAVVYTFDKAGAVWKTSDGGDGTLTASALGRVFISDLTSATPLLSKLCDSADYQFQFTYSDCDSLLVTGIAFLDDQIGELSAPKKANFFGKDNTRFDTLIIRFKPRKVHAATERIRITFRQPDGFLQDTIIAVSLKSLPATDIPFITEASGNTLDFGVRSICGDDSVRTLTITNTGCSTMNVDSLATDGPPFFLLSSFDPFSLDPGISRTVLLQFKPHSIGAGSGKLRLITSDSSLIISLTGTGVAGTRGYKLSEPQITSTICDSAEGDITFKNISCTPVRLDSIGIDAPFRFDPIGMPAIIGSDSTILLHYHFVPKIPGTYSNTIVIHSLNDNDSNDRFDTTLTLGGIATRGEPGITLSATSLDFGAINTCSFNDLEVTITNSGCDTLKITDAILEGLAKGYSILSSPKDRNILRGSSDTFTLRFKPSGLVVFLDTVHLVTNAGEYDILLIGIGTNDPGTLTFDVTPIGSVLTCLDSVFTFTLSNTTCDSLYLDSLIFTGNASADYSLSSFGQAPMPSGKQLLIAAKFSPQANGVRDAIAHCFLHLADGSIKEITLALGGIGKQPNVMQLSLPNITLQAVPGSSVLLPFQLLDTSVIPVAGIDISVNLNTDLLEPVSFDLSGSVISGAAVQPLAISKTGVGITINLPTPKALGVGLLGTLVMRSYLSDSGSTEISLSDFAAFDSVNSRTCLPTAVITPPQIVTSFVLTNECGDSSLSEYLRNGISGLLIEKITPNPTDNFIYVTIRLPKHYQNDGILEIFDALGNHLQSEPLVSADGSSEITQRVSLSGASGLRMLRVRTPSTSSSQNIYLLK